jgi:hypothetical protein
MPLKKFLKPIAIFVLFAVWNSFLIEPASPQSRDAEVIVETSDGKPLPLYRASYALVIGVSAYTNGWPILPAADDDAREVKAALEQHGFVVTLVENPTAARLDSEIKSFFARRGLDKENRLLFYFAGHGHTQRMSYGGDLGYIVPSDAPLPDKNPGDFLQKAISMESFSSFARNTNAKHVLFIFDSCFSGSIFALARAVPEVISYKTSQAVRQFISAGSANETVPDASIFKQQFLAALQGEGDTNKDGYVTGVELGEFLLDRVVTYSREAQHPQHGKIRDPKLDKGDFVFVVPVKLPPSPELRGDPLSNLSVGDANAMILAKGFFDNDLNNNANGWENQYELRTIAGDEVVVDKSTGLMWQKSGSPNDMVYAEAQKWIANLNDKGFANARDWRLPTLEEAMSLMESGEMNGDLHIDSKFDKTQRWIWTADQESAGMAWLAGFDFGGCFREVVQISFYIRAVRFGQ